MKAVFIPPKFSLISIHFQDFSQAFFKFLNSYNKEQKDRLEKPKIGLTILVKSWNGKDLNSFA
jgi:hypothetical protein